MSGVYVSRRIAWSVIGMKNLIRYSDSPRIVLSASANQIFVTFIPSSLKLALKMTNIGKTAILEKYEYFVLTIWEIQAGIRAEGL